MVPVKELNEMRAYFESGITLEADFRKKQLQKWKSVLQQNEQEIYSALYADLKKSPEECWVTENGFLLSEINQAISELDQWMKPVSVNTNLVNLPSSSFIMKEPLGVVLVIAPWNYPLMLLLVPVIGAMAAGNCVVLKSSEHAAATTALVKKMVQENFDQRYLYFAEGDGSEIIPAMMNDFVFDHVFFTGSTAVGKSVYEMAAKNLVPVTLELGGKSPCVVEADANVKVAARRIVMTKFSNAGQMCVAPDFLLVHHSVKNALVTEMIAVIKKFFGNSAEDCYEFGKIINERQFNRICKYLTEGKIVHGGRTIKEKLFIEPTILDEIKAGATVMQDEIFGPVLPVLSFDKKEEAMAVIRQHKNPLAFYVFTSSKSKEKDWLSSVPFGGGCVNNASWHLTNHNLPFGGRGFSGTGQYHGKFSFDTFSHQKAIMKTPTWFDPSVKYPPFKGKLRLFKWVIR